MHILEVMRRLHHESEVAFLLSAYAETLQHLDGGSSLPKGVATLPLRGVDDVRYRFEALLDVELNGNAARSGNPVHAIVREAVEIFGMGLTRMQSLAAARQAVPAMPQPRAVLAF